MMEAVRQWGFAICCAAVAGGIAQMLSPQGSLQKVFRMTLGAFFLCSLLYPLLTITPELRFELDNTQIENRMDIAQRLQESVDGQFLSELSGSLEEEIRKKLADMGINEAQITVYINGEGQSALTAEDIVAEVVLDQAFAGRHDELVRNLEYQLGVTVRMGYVQS